MPNEATPSPAGQVARDDLCFCCGRDNEQGLKLVFAYEEKGTATAKLIIPQWFSGWRRMTHGGLLSTLLDECMAHAVISQIGHAITAELTVRFHSPVEVGTEITLKGTVVSARSKIIETSGVIHDSQGGRVATGKARFLLVDPQPNSQSSTT